MEETTTTNAPVDTGEVQTIQGIAIDDQGQAISQPEDTDQAQAAVETTETENTQEATSEPSEDEQLTKFAAAKGVTLDSDNAKKLAKMAMNAEKAMHSKATRASELLIVKQREETDKRVYNYNINPIFIDSMKALILNNQ
jgi:uncharacterized protein YbaP (TraB family)